MKPGGGGWVVGRWYGGERKKRMDEVRRFPYLSMFEQKKGVKIPENDLIYYLKRKKTPIN